MHFIVSDNLWSFQSLDLSEDFCRRHAWQSTAAVKTQIECLIVLMCFYRAHYLRPSQKPITLKWRQRKETLAVFFWDISSSLDGKMGDNSIQSASWMVTALSTERWWQEKHLLELFTAPWTWNISKNTQKIVL